MTNQINMFRTAFTFYNTVIQEASGSFYISGMDVGSIEDPAIVDMELTVRSLEEFRDSFSGIHPLVVFLNLMETLGGSYYTIHVRVNENKRLFYYNILGGLRPDQIREYDELHFSIFDVDFETSFSSRHQLFKTLNQLYKPTYHASSQDNDLYKVVGSNENYRINKVDYTEKKLFNTMSVYAEGRQVRQKALTQKAKPQGGEQKVDINGEVIIEINEQGGDDTMIVSQLELDELEETSMQELLFGFVAILPRSKCMEIDDTLYHAMYKSLKIRALQDKVTATFDALVPKGSVRKLNSNMLSAEERLDVKFRLVQRENKARVFKDMEKKLLTLGHKYYNHPWAMGKDGQIYKFVMPNVLHLDQEPFKKVVYLRAMPALGLRPRAHFNYRSSKILPDSLLFLVDLKISIQEYQDKFMYTETGAQFNEFVADMVDHFENHVFSKLCLDSQVERITLIYEMAHKLIFANPISVINLAAQPGTEAFSQLEQMNREMLQLLHHEDTEDFYLDELPSYYFINKILKLNNEGTAAGQPHRTYHDHAKTDFNHPYRGIDIQKTDFKFDAYGVADQVFYMWKENWRNGIDDTIMSIYNTFPDAFLSNAVPKDEVYHVRKIDGPGTRTIYSTSIVSLILTMPFLSMVENLFPSPHKYQYVKQWMKLSTSGEEYHHVVKEFITEASLNGFAYRVMADNMYIIKYDQTTDEFDYYSLDGAKFEVSTTGNYLSALFKVIIEEWFSDGDKCNFNQDWQTFIIYMMPRMIAQYYNKFGELVLSPVAVLGDRVFKPSQLLSGSAGTKLINTFRMMTIANAIVQSPDKSIDKIIYIARSLGVQLTIESNFKFVNNLVEKQIYETDILGYNTIRYGGFYRPILKYDSLVNIMLFPKAAYTMYADGDDNLEAGDEKLIIILMSYVMLQLGGIVYNNLAVWANQYIRNRISEVQDVLGSIALAKLETGRTVDELAPEAHPTIVGILEMLTSSANEMLRPTIYNDKIRKNLLRPLALLRVEPYVEKKVTVGIFLLLHELGQKVVGFTDKIINANIKQMSKHTFDLLNRFHTDVFAVKSASTYGKNTAPVLVLPAMSINRHNAKDNRLTTIAISATVSDTQRKLKIDYQLINNQIKRELDLHEVKIEELIRNKDRDTLASYFNAINNDKIFNALIGYIPNSLMSQIFCKLVSPTLDINDDKGIVTRAYLQGEQVIFGDESGEIIDSETLEKLDMSGIEEKGQEDLEKIFVSRRNQTNTALRIVLTQYLTNFDSDTTNVQYTEYAKGLAEVYGVDTGAIYGLITTISKSLPNSAILYKFFNIRKENFVQVLPKPDEPKIRRLVIFYIITTSKTGVELMVKSIGSHLDLHGKRVEYAAVYLKDFLVAEFKIVPLSRGKILFSQSWEKSMKNIINSHPEEFTGRKINEFRQKKDKRSKESIIEIVTQKRQDRLHAALLPPDLLHYNTQITSFNLTQTIEEIEDLSGLLTLDYRSIDLTNSDTKRKLFEYLRAFFAYIDIYIQPVPREIQQGLEQKGYSCKNWLVLSQNTAASMQHDEAIVMENEQDLYVQVMLNRITRDLVGTDDDIKTHHMYNIVENTYRIVNLTLWYVQYHYDTYVHQIIMKIMNFDHAINVHFNQLLGLPIVARPTGENVENHTLMSIKKREYDNKFVKPYFIQNFNTRVFDYPPIEMALDVKLFKMGFEFKQKDGHSTQLRTHIQTQSIETFNFTNNVIKFDKIEESMHIIKENYKKFFDILETDEFETKYMFSVDKLEYINGDKRVTKVSMPPSVDVMHIYPITLDIKYQNIIMNEIFQHEGNFETYYDEYVFSRIDKTERKITNLNEDQLVVGMGSIQQSSSKLYQMFRMGAETIQVVDSKKPIAQDGEVTINQDASDEQVENAVHRLADLMTNVMLHPTVTQAEWTNKMIQNVAGDNIFLNIYADLDSRFDLRDYGDKIMMYVITSEFASHQRLMETEMKHISKINVYADRHPHILNLIGRNKRANEHSRGILNMENYVPSWERELSFAGAKAIAYKFIIQKCIDNFDLNVKGMTKSTTKEYENDDIELVNFFKAKEAKRQRKRKNIIQEQTREITRLFNEYLGDDNFNG